MNMLKTSLMQMMSGSFMKYLYCCGLCIAQLNAKRGLEKNFEPDYTLNKALGTLFTMLRVSKRKTSRLADETSKLVLS